MSPLRSILDWYGRRKNGKKKRIPAKRTAGSFSPKTYSKKKERIGKLKRWGFLFILCFIFWFIYDLPSLAPLTKFNKAPSITVKAEDGSILGTYGDVYGDYVPYDQLPPDLIHAVVATEDRNFFYHFGIDPLGIIRAVWVDLRARRMVQGGSTITQQVAKNLFLTSDRHLYRKLQEAVLAVWLECKFTKKQILTLYLNRMYLGAGSFGVDAASRRYFNHPARELTLPESAVLVGLLKAPSKYAPTHNPDLSEQRGEQVLVNMVNAGYLKPKQADRARRELLLSADLSGNNNAFGAFYFSDWIVEQLPGLLGGPLQQDVVVTTTLRPALQNIADSVVKDGLDQNSKRIHASQAALLSMTPDGAIRAMVGGRNYQQSQYNRATQAQRQPGSSFKPFVYLAGIEAGFMPDTPIEDKPITVDNWTPHNYTGDYQGTITVAYALAHSINTVAVQISELVGRGKVIGMARRLGITSEMEYVPSIALGALEVNLLELTQAYAHLAANGKQVQAYGIEQVTDSKGNLLYQHQTNASPPEVLRPNVVAMMNSLLEGVIQFGTGRGANIGRSAAGKTGTTSDYKDAWFIGYTPDLVTGVWLGNDDNTSMKKVTGGNLPATIWHGYMQAALKDTPAHDLPISYRVDETGILPWQLGPQQVKNGFKPGSAPSANPFAPPAGSTEHTPTAAGAEEEMHGAPMPDPNAVPPDATDAPEEPAPLPQSFWDKLNNEDDKASPPQQ